MIHHSKGLDLEITDFEYHHDLTYTGEIIPSQSSSVLYVDNNLLCETELSISRAERVKKAKLDELSNNISERRGEL